jgi:hypothetical protein
MILQSVSDIIDLKNPRGISHHFIEKTRYSGEPKAVPHSFRDYFAVRRNDGTRADARARFSGRRKKKLDKKGFFGQFELVNRGPQVTIPY